MENNNAPLLEMRSIKKDFFGNQVLTDISFTLREGEVLGLVGENGAGKSTLIRCRRGHVEGAHAVGARRARDVVQIEIGHGGHARTVPGQNHGGVDKTEGNAPRAARPRKGGEEFPVLLRQRGPLQEIRPSRERRGQSLAPAPGRDGAVIPGTGCPSRTGGRV